jgi:hypothetical protein
MVQHDDREQRIGKILGSDNLTVSLKSLTLYRDYLRKHLDMPCIMTGIEGFPWDNKYVFGYADEAEYEALKRDHPSPADIYELKRFEDLIDEDAGILVKVKRVKDNRRFILDLAWLKAVDESSGNHGLLDDYSTWFANRSDQ